MAGWAAKRAAPPCSLAGNSRMYSARDAAATWKLPLVAVRAT